MSKWSVTNAMVLVLLTASCDKKPHEGAPAARSSTAASAESAEVDDTILASFKPALPSVFESRDNPLTEEKIVLGRALYYETRLSASNEISCNTCHLLSTDGADGRQFSAGHKKQSGKRNSPSVYNAAGHFVQFWDGRAKDVEEQAKGPILNPVEMAMQDEKGVVAELERVPWYREQFQKAFPDARGVITMDHVARAIGAFERKLSTPARWDKFLNGDRNALSREEKAGFKKFVQTGCNSCHLGTLVGGSMFQKLGLVKPWPKTDDLGRFEHTKNEADKMSFKVPSLRNVEKTAPYFHDGSVATLEEAVTLMARHQLGRELEAADVASIVTWLRSLSGEIPRDYVAEYRVPAEIPPAPSVSAVRKP